MQRTDGVHHDTLLLLLHLLCKKETSKDAEHHGDFLLVVFCSLNNELADSDVYMCVAFV